MTTYLKLCHHCRRSCGMAMVGREFVLAHRDWNAAGELVDAPAQRRLM